MLNEEEIRGALRARLVVPLGVANPHGPLGLEHLAAALACATREGAETLAIMVRRETREKLERLACREGATAAHPLTAAEVAAAIVEQYVSAAPLS